MRANMWRGSALRALPDRASRRQVAVHGSGLGGNGASSDPGGKPGDWGALAATSFLLGAVVGPPLDGIHGSVQLLQYDALPLELGPLKTSVWVSAGGDGSARRLQGSPEPHRAQVFGLLGTFYGLTVPLVAYLDRRALEGDDPAATATATARSQPVASVALAFGAVAAFLGLSAAMYAADVPYWQIHAALAPMALGFWYLADGTRHGLALVSGWLALASHVSPGIRSEAHPACRAASWRWARPWQRRSS